MNERLIKKMEMLYDDKRDMPFDLVINEIIPKERETYDLCLFSDLHVGHKNYDYYAFLRNFNWLLNDKEGINYKLLSVGDLFEMAIKKHRESQVLTPTEQYEFLYDYFKQFGTRYIGAIEGNHEARINETGFYAHEIFCKSLGILNFGNRALIKLNLRRTPKGKKTSYILYGIHGKGNATTITGKMNKLMKLIGVYKDADLYFHAHCHTHQQDFSAPFHYNEHTGKNEQQVVIFVMTGHSLKYGKDYAEGSSYAPTGKANHRRIKFYVDKKKMKVVG